MITTETKETSRNCLHFSTINNHLSTRKSIINSNHTIKKYMCICKSEKHSNTDTYETCIHTVHTCVCTYIHETCIHTVHTCVCVHTYTRHVYIPHTCVCVYIHTRDMYTYRTYVCVCVQNTRSVFEFVLNTVYNHFIIKQKLNTILVK